MRLNIVLWSIYIFSFSSVFAKSPQLPKTYSVEQFLNKKSYHSSSFSPKEDKLLIGCDETGVPNVYTISLKDKKILPVTSSVTEAMYPITYFPNDERMLLKNGAYGTRRGHILMRELNGKIKDLTPYENTVNYFLGFRHDDKAFYFETSFNSDYMDIYEMDIATFQKKLIFKNGQGLVCRAFSDNGRYIAFKKWVTEDVSKM